MDGTQRNRARDLERRAAETAHAEAGGQRVGTSHGEPVGVDPISAEEVGEIRGMLREWMEQSAAQQAAELHVLRDLYDAATPAPAAVLFYGSFRHEGGYARDYVIQLSEYTDYAANATLQLVTAGPVANPLVYVSYDSPMQRAGGPPAPGEWTVAGAIQPGSVCKLHLSNLRGVRRLHLRCDPVADATLVITNGSQADLPSHGS